MFKRLGFAIKNAIDCIPLCKSLLIKAALSCLTAVYVSEKDDYNRSLYNELKVLLLRYRDDREAYCELNLKYKLYLWCFGRVDFVHKFGAHLSSFTKQIKSKLN